MSETACGTMRTALTKETITKIAMRAMTIQTTIVPAEGSFMRVLPLWVVRSCGAGRWGGRGGRADRVRNRR